MEPPENVFGLCQIFHSFLSHEQYVSGMIAFLSAFVAPFSVLRKAGWGCRVTYVSESERARCVFDDAASMRARELSCACDWILV